MYILDFRQFLNEGFLDKYEPVKNGKINAMQETVLNIKNNKLKSVCKEIQRIHVIHYKTKNSVSTKAKTLITKLDNIKHSVLYNELTDYDKKALITFRSFAYDLT